MSGQPNQTYKIFKYAVEGKTKKIKDILKKGFQFDKNTSHLY